MTALRNKERKNKTGASKAPARATGKTTRERPADSADLSHVLTAVRCILWSAVVEELPGGGFSWDTDVFNESAAEELLPLKRRAGESYSDVWHTHVPPEDRLRMDEISAQALRSGRTRYSQEFRCERADGQVRWLYEDTRIEPLSESRWRLTGICTDITERKEAESRLRLSQELYRAMVDLQSDMICRYTTDCILTYVNDTVCRFTGQTREQLIGSSFLPFIPEERREHVLQELKTIRPDAPTNTNENPVVLPDGQTRWFQWLNRAIFDDTGRCVEVQAVGRDITELRAAQRDQRFICEGLRCVVAIADELMSCSDIDTLCRRGVELARDRLGLERCAIFLREGEFLSGTYGTDRRGGTTDEKSHRFPASAHWIERMQTLSPEDRRTVFNEGPYTEVTEEGAVTFGRGWIAMTPIQAADELVGLFCNDTAITGLPASEPQQEVVAVYCSLLGAVLKRKQFEMRNRRLTEGLRATAGIADALIACPDLDSLYRNAVEMARERLGVERCAIFVREGSSLMGTYGTGRNGRTTTERGHRFAASEDWIERINVLKTSGQRIVVVEQPYYEWKDGKSVPFGRGWVGVTPIRSTTEFMGVFCNDTALSGAPIDETLQDILTVFCSLLGAIIERKMTEVHLRQLSDGLRSVASITDELIRCPDLDTLHRAAVEKARERLGVERGALFLFDGQQLRGTFGTSLARQTTDEHIHAVEPESAWLARFRSTRPDERQMIINQEPYTEWENGHVTRFSNGWVALTPIQSESRLLGVFSNDTAISRAPIDHALQEILSVYCSVLGAVIERRRAEQALRQAHDELEKRVGERTAELVQVNLSLRNAQRSRKAILDNIPDMAWLKDGDSRFIAVNEAFARACGRAAEQLPGKTDLDIWPQELAERYRADDFDVMRSRKSRLIEEPLAEADGKTRWIETIKTPILSDQGEVIGTTGIARDITERKRAEEILRRSHDELEQLVGERTADIASANEALRHEIAERKRAEVEIRRLAMVVEQEAEAVVISDTHGTIFYVNPAFERMTGYPRNEVIGANPRILKSGRQDADFYRRMWDTLTGGAIWCGHMTNRRKDGTLYDVETTISPIRDETSQIVNYVATSRDITHELQLEQQFQRAQRMEAVGRLAGGIAHDFNNLLTSILGYGRLLLDDLGEGSPLRADVEEIIRAGDRAAALTKQLLTFSRKQMIQPKPIQLNAVLMDMDKLLRRTLGEDIELVTVVDSGSTQINADSGLMEQVVLNLAVNARDAMPKGGTLTIETSTASLDEEYGRRHKDMKPGTYVILTVRDTGEGMTDEVREHCFEPFFTTKETGKGTGLGLAIVYSIARQFGGFVEIESAPAAGTTVRILLAALSEPAAPPAPKVEEDLPRGTETILLVEDEDTVRRLAVRILESLGYQVMNARHGGEALLICERYKSRIDLVLTDVVMPHLGGQELVERLRTVRTDFKVLYMSGFTDGALVREEDRDPGVPLLVKPFTREALAVKVRRVLDGR